MNLTFISSMETSPWGGCEELWSRAALQFCKRGHRVSASVAYWAELSPNVKKLREHGIDLFVRSRHGLAQRVWQKAWRYFHGKAPGARRWLLSKSPDLVIISQGGNWDGLDWMSLCRGENVPFVSIVQCNTEAWWPEDELALRIGNAYQSAERVFCVSNSNLKLLERQIGRRLSNASVVWNAFNCSPDEPVPWPEENGEWKIACVARLEPAAKGQDLLFETISAPSWQNRPFGINLYGQGAWSNNLRNLASDLSLNNVHFCGHLNDVQQIWKENHLLVLPSRFEGLPLALVEAMWCSRAAVVTDVGGNAEICVDGETGFVAAAPTVKFFDEALERAWQRRHDWRQLGIAARRRAEKLIPKDPVDVFCRELLDCIKST